MPVLKQSLNINADGTTYAYTLPLYDTAVPTEEPYSSYIAAVSQPST